MPTDQEPYSARSGSGQRGGVVDGRKLWTGGVITAVIVFGLAIAGFLFVRGILNFPILGIRPGGAVVHASMFGYASGAALVALLATAGMHLLLIFPCAHDVTHDLRGGSPAPSRCTMMRGPRWAPLRHPFHHAGTWCVPPGSGSVDWLR